MTRDIERIVEVFSAMDGLLERVEPTWWGAVVTDRRFPAIWDVNYARVERSHPDLGLAEVEEALLPALAEASALHQQIVLFDPRGMDALIEQARRRGDEVGWDTSMGFGFTSTRLPDDLPPHSVEELDAPDRSFWRAQLRAFVEFDVKGDDALQQIVDWERSVLLPSGKKRWFVVRDPAGPEGFDGFAGFGALVQHEGIGYVDNVVTLPALRRRGIAAAVVARILREARAAGAHHVYLLADDPGAIRIYRRLGFHDTGRIGHTLRRLAGGPGSVRSPSGSSSATPSP